MADYFTKEVAARWAAMFSDMIERVIRPMIENERQPDGLLGPQGLVYERDYVYIEEKIKIMRQQHGREIPWLAGAILFRMHERGDYHYHLNDLDDDFRIEFYEELKRALDAFQAEWNTKRLNEYKSIRDTLWGKTGEITSLVEGSDIFSEYPPKVVENTPSVLKAYRAALRLLKDLVDGYKDNMPEKLHPDEFRVVCFNIKEKYDPEGMPLEPENQTPGIHIMRLIYLALGEETKGYDYPTGLTGLAKLIQSRKFSFPRYFPRPADSKDPPVLIKDKTAPPPPRKPAPSVPTTAAPVEAAKTPKAAEAKTVVQSVQIDEYEGQPIPPPPPREVQEIPPPPPRKDQGGQPIPPPPPPREVQGVQGGQPIPPPPPRKDQGGQPIPPPPPRPVPTMSTKGGTDAGDAAEELRKMAERRKEGRIQAGMVSMIVGKYGEPGVKRAMGDDMFSEPPEHVDELSMDNIRTEMLNTGSLEEFEEAKRRFELWKTFKIEAFRKGIKNHDAEADKRLSEHLKQESAPAARVHPQKQEEQRKKGRSEDEEPSVRGVVIASEKVQTQYEELAKVGGHARPHALRVQVKPQAHQDTFRSYGELIQKGGQLTRLKEKLREQVKDVAERPIVVIQQELETPIGVVDIDMPKSIESAQKAYQAGKLTSAQVVDLMKIALLSPDDEAAEDCLQKVCEIVYSIEKAEAKPSLVVTDHFRLEARFITNAIALLIQAHSNRNTSGRMGRMCTFLEVVSVHDAVFGTVQEVNKSFHDVGQVLVQLYLRAAAAEYRSRLAILIQRCSMKSRSKLQVELTCFEPTTGPVHWRALEVARVLYKGWSRDLMHFVNMFLFYAYHSASCMEWLSSENVQVLGNSQEFLDEMFQANQGVLFFIYTVMERIRASTEALEAEENAWLQSFRVLEYLLFAQECEDSLRVFVYRHVLLLLLSLEDSPPKRYVELKRYLLTLQSDLYRILPKEK
jgi:hypothetical protein